MSKVKYQPFITVVVPTYNRGIKIQDCIDSLCKQTYKNIEIVICDDKSTDETVQIVNHYCARDSRIKLFTNKVNLGASGARNTAIKHAKGEIIFFTDDDVMPPKDWIEKGIKYFEDHNVVGIEGKIVYVSDNYMRRYGDRLVENLTGGLFMTANAAYRRKGLLQVGLFDLAYKFYQDRAIALLLMNYGKIVYAPDVVVFHQLERYSYESFMREAQKIKYHVLLMKQFGDRNNVISCVHEPAKLLTILFPPIVLVKLFTENYVDRKDYALFFLIYPRLCYERILFWRYCISEKLFLL